MEILGFAIPRLINADPQLLVIEMSMVEPPFLIDCAQSVLDEPLDFPDGMDEWWERVEAVFGDHFERARDVYFKLQNMTGIYYYDLAPRNLNFGE